MTVLALDRAAVMGLIPHREPMLLIDRIPFMEPGLRAIAIAADLRLCAPAVPRNRTGAIPPELLVEGIAQTSAAVVAAGRVASGEFPAGEPQPGVLGAVPEMRFPAPAPEGAEVTFRVEVMKRLGRLILLEGEAHAGAVLVAQGTMSIALGKPGG